MIVSTLPLIMKITELIALIALHKLSLYKFDIFEQSTKNLDCRKQNPSQIRKKEFIKPIDQNIFSPSEFQTQITIFRDFKIQVPGEKQNKLEQKIVNNKLLDQLKSARISFESKIINLFIYRLSNLNELQQELIKAASHEPNRVLSIYSSFFIQKKQKRQLLKVIKEKLNTDAQVEFQIMKTSNLEIELRDRGYKISSNLDYCITELGTQVEDQAATENYSLKKIIRT